MLFIKICAIYDGEKQTWLRASRSFCMEGAGGGHSTSAFI